MTTDERDAKRREKQIEEFRRKKWVQSRSKG